MHHRTLASLEGAPADTRAAVDTFLDRYSGDTVKTYRTALERFHAWHPTGDILHATRAEIELFSRHLQDEVGLKKSTVYGYIGTLSQFFRVALSDGRIDRDPTVMVRRPKVRYDPDRFHRLTSHDVEKLLLTAEARSPQHLALVALLGGLGLRIGETVSIRIEDFGFERGHRVLHLVRKGGKPSTGAVPPMIWRMIAPAIGDRTEGPLFTTRTGRQMSRHDAYKRLQVLARHAGLPPVNPHLLRHAAITALLDAGVPHRDIIAFAGWEDGRMLIQYDRAMRSLDRHASYVLAARFSAISDRIAA